MIFNWFDWRKDSGKEYPKIHPSQKPISVLKRLIEIFTDEGDVVIDPCAGSGSTLRAARELGRHSYGFEVSRDFYTKPVSRCSDRQRGRKQMSNDIMVFSNANFGEIRTLTMDGEPWFIGKDVAEKLGYAEPRSAVSKRVDKEDRGVAKMETPSGVQEMTIINESGLYSLIIGSKLPSARKFKRWVTSEVLPAIRKHGMYAVDDLIANPELAIQAFTALKEEREKRKALETQAAAQAKQIEEMQPKVTNYDIVLNCKDLVSVNTIAKDYGKSAIWLNKWLHDHGIQYRQGKVWILYQKYAKKGYAKSRTRTFSDSDGGNHARVHTYWTQVGRIFIYDLLKENGILPLIEQEGGTA